MTRNVLLMFSTDQPPDPVEELRWHAPQCVVDDTTAVVTTRVLTGLTPDGSAVAFYGARRWATTSSRVAPSWSTSRLEPIGAGDRP
jgi:hypothetical protein